MINIEMGMRGMKRNTMRMEMVNTMNTQMKMGMILIVVIPISGLEKIIYSS
jgi:hypothetical protein